MKEAVSAAIGLIVIAVVVMIGGAMVAVTQNVTLGIAPNSTLITTLATYTGNSLTTFASLLSVLALAVIGGLAIGYLVFFLGGVFGGGRGAL